MLFKKFGGMDITVGTVAAMSIGTMIIAKPPCENWSGPVGRFSRPRMKKANI